MHVLESFSISPLFYNTSSTNVFFSIFCGMGEKKRELKKWKGKKQKQNTFFYITINLFAYIPTLFFYDDLSNVNAYEIQQKYGSYLGNNNSSTSLYSLFQHFFSVLFLLNRVEDNNRTFFFVSVHTFTFILIMKKWKSREYAGS